jgi:hypothetical protein
MWNLIVDGKVTEQFAKKPVFHPSLLLVEGSASLGYLYDGTSFSEPSSPPDPTYQENRVAEYPPIGDQLDEIYHNGLTKWKATIKVIKDKYPKE